MQEVAVGMHGYVGARDAVSSRLLAHAPGHPLCYAKRRGEKGFGVGRRRCLLLYGSPAEGFGV